MGLTALLALGAACGGPTPVPSPEPLPTVPVAVVTLPSPTATPAAEATGPTEIATPTPAATETPASRLNPLTGLPVADPAMFERRPLVIKIAHFPRSVREWQAGLSFADNVWETYAEGGVIRFGAVFWSQAPERAGNVRSARLVDAILADAYQAILVASGSSDGTMARLRSNAEVYSRMVAEATGYRDCPVLCREESVAVTTNKLFTAPPELWKLAAAKSWGAPQNLTGYAFAAPAPTGGATVTTIRLDWQLNNTVSEWRYDAATGQYARWVDTADPAELAPHVDTLTDQPLTAANVVVVYAPYVPANIVEAEGAFSYDILLTGEGEARLFRDGQMWTGKWQRASEPHSLPRFVDANGAELPLKPGVTWFALYSTASITTVDEAQALFQARFRAASPFSHLPDASTLARAP